LLAAMTICTVTVRDRLFNRERLLAHKIKSK
jgi:hypothetical protein